MSLEKQFRAWLPDFELMIDEYFEGNEIIPFEDFHWSCSAGYIDVYVLELLDREVGGNHVQDYYFKLQENSEILQFTGLKDKKGVKIYEGDIVKTYNCKSPLEIIFRNACFCVKSASGGISDLYELAPVSMQAIEVIGNIYENPELINQ